MSEVTLTIRPERRRGVLLVGRKGRSSSSRRQYRFRDEERARDALARWAADGFDTFWLFVPEGCGERLTDPPPAAAPPVIATRVTMHEAKRHFEAGGAVLVSEYGHEPTQTVTAITTTHDRTRTTWDALAADVKEWRNRYPNQRFYIVPRPGVVAVDDARPADPEVSE